MFYSENEGYNFTALLTEVVSGKMGDDGIENLMIANIMLDDDGDPEDRWIEVEEGRLLKMMTDCPNGWRLSVRAPRV